MIDLVKIELLKLRTQPVNVVILGLGLVLPVAGMGLLFLATRVEDAAQLQFGSPQMQRQLLTGAGMSLVVLLVSILGMTSEFRHRTISTTLAAVPDRRRVVAGKALAYALVALAYSAGAALLGQIAARLILEVQGIDVVLSNATIARSLVKNIAGQVLFAALGLGVATIVANQVAAILIVLLEPIAGSITTIFLPKIGKFLPSQAAGAFMTGDPGGGTLLAEWTAAAVFVGYVAAALLAGAMLLAQRDIT